MKTTRLIGVILTMLYIGGCIVYSGLYYFNIVTGPKIIHFDPAAGIFVMWAFGGFLLGLIANTFKGRTIEDEAEKLWKRSTLKKLELMQKINPTWIPPGRGRKCTPKEAKREVENNTDYGRVWVRMHRIWFRKNHMWGTS